MNEKMKKDLETWIVLLFFSFLFAAYGPYNGMLASLGIGSGVVDRPVERPLPPSTPLDQAQNDSVTAEDIIASLSIGASNIAEQNLPPSVQKELGLLKKLGVEEKILEGEVMTAIIDTRNSAAGEIIQTHFFDTLNKTFYRVDDSFQDLDKKRGKKLKIKARVKGRTIKSADIIEDQGSTSPAGLKFGPVEAGTAFGRCSLSLFPGWPGLGPWLVGLSSSASSDGINISTTPISGSISTPILDDNSTLLQSVESSAPFSGTKKTLVIVVDFYDQKVQAADGVIRDWYFGPSGSISDQSVASFYNTASTDRILFSGDLIRVQIKNKWNGGAFVCDTGADDPPFLYWGAEALDEVDKEGVDEADYDLVSFVFPAGSCSDFLGLAYNYSEYSFVFFAGPDTPTHEIGHNFGLPHAMTPTNEYGDITDIMGEKEDQHSNFVFFNSVHTRAFHWYPDHLITKNVGTYRIAPMSALNTSAPKIIKIPEIFPWLVSYRIFDGLDENLEGSAIEGVYLHAWNTSR